MDDDSDSKRNYKVGKGKPPEHTRFKPGQSGNPSGRPKGTRSWKSIWNQKLRGSSFIIVNGKRKRINNQKLLVDAAYAHALKGNLNLMKALDGLDAVPPEPEPEVKLSFTLKLEEDPVEDPFDDDSGDNSML